MITRSRVGASLIVATLLLSACSKSPQDMACDDGKVQTQVRQLLAMKISDWQQPIGSAENLMRQYQPDMPELQATLNGIRSSNIQIDGITLVEIKQDAAPQSPLLDADPPDDGKFVPQIYQKKKTGNKLLYQCSAIAKLRLPVDRVAQLPATTRKALSIDGDQITAGVQYQTELTPKEDLWVAAGFSHPLIEISIRSLLSQANTPTEEKQVAKDGQQSNRLLSPQ